MNDRMTPDPIICVHIGRSTWQGPASAAPRMEDRMTRDPEAAERVAQVLSSSCNGLWNAEAAALIRAQTAEIERLTALDTPAPQPDADEREAMVTVIGNGIFATPADHEAIDLASNIADALPAAGWTRKREDGRC